MTSGLLAGAAFAAGALIALLLPAPLAQAYIGGSFLSVPDLAGDATDPGHKGWIAFDAHYWKARFPGGLEPGSLAELSAHGVHQETHSFLGPTAPEHGASTLYVELDKRSPALAQMMRYCATKQSLGAPIFDESSIRARASGEIGPKPGTVPEYFEYRLMNAVIGACPTVADAPSQAFAIDFDDIDWVNYQGHDQPVAFPAGPSDRAPSAAAAQSAWAGSPPEGRKKAFVITWLGVGNYAGSDQCQAVNQPPAEEAYFAYRTKDQAAQDRIELQKTGGLAFTRGESPAQDERMAFRGPDRLNVCSLPGIVPDPGHIAPRTGIAHGLDLDGTDGQATGATCAHRKYVSEDGRAGIDNQLFTVEGCIAGLQGPKGYVLQLANRRMHDSLLSILIEIGGLHDDKTDEPVEVSIYYSLDAMAKNAAGDRILPDYTFRASDKPQYAYYDAHLHGHRVNGVVTTDPVDILPLYLTEFGTPPELKLKGARMRLEILPDGTLKGVLGGYQDWHEIDTATSYGTLEHFHGLQCPALYNALKRAADGYRDPATGDCTAISSAYDIEGIPAFVLPPRGQAAQGEKAEASLPAPSREATP